MNPMLWSVGTAPPPGVTLFFALKPSPAVAQRMATLGEIIGGAQHLKGHWMRPDLLHLTLGLCHQGRDGLPDAARRAVAAAQGLRQQPLQIIFDRSCSFPNGGGQHPFVLRGAHDMEELAAFRAVLRARMRRAGLPPIGSFTPHVTLSWADRIVAPHPIAPLCWNAEELLLIESHVGLARHVTVARWPLLQIGDGHEP